MLVPPFSKAPKAVSWPARTTYTIATTTYMSTIDRAVATMESRRKRSPSGTLMSSVERLLPFGSTSRPTAPAAT